MAMIETFPLQMFARINYLRPVLTEDIRILKTAINVAVPMAGVETIVKVWQVTEVVSRL